MRTDVPETIEYFIPDHDWHFPADFKEKDEVYTFKKKEKQNYDRAHRTRDVEPIPNDTSVWVRTENSQCLGTLSLLPMHPDHISSYLVSISHLDK